MLHTFSVVCTEVVMSDPNRHVGNEVVPLGSFCIRTRRVGLCSRAWHVCLKIAVISALPQGTGIKKYLFKYKYYERFLFVPCLVLPFVLDLW